MGSTVHSSHIPLQMVDTVGHRMDIHAQQTLQQIAHIKMDLLAATLLAASA
jgi:hypothetical protein